MADIKVKDMAVKTIKTIDKVGTLATKTKDVIIDVKTKFENQNTDTSTLDYGNSKINSTTRRTTNEVVKESTKFNKYGKESVLKTKDNFQKSKVKVKGFKKKLAEKKNLKNLNIKLKGKIKNVNKGIKNSKTTYKLTEKSFNNSKRSMKFAKATAKKTIQSIKQAIKITMSAVKGIIASTKALISLIIAGGWIAVFLIIILIMAMMLFGSIFGIFFSSDSSVGSRTMNSVVMELNTELANKITDIQDSETYDDYTITNNRAEWKEILAIYVAKVTDGREDIEVITLNDDKVAILKQVFWDMNKVTYTVKTETVTDSFTDYMGNTTTTLVDKKILNIVISSKSIIEMETLYYFNYAQKAQVNELMKEEYDNLWGSVIYGTSIGSLNMVEIAASQLGNIGGQPYWSWYGFTSRVEWCATFVSWVAEQAGYISAGLIPKFSGVETGIEWFKLMGLWKGKGFTPKAGDIIFFDWDGNGTGDHVGIVEMVLNNTVYTIEGNTSDSCARRSYSINSNDILGYGTPAY